MRANEGIAAFGAPFADHQLVDFQVAAAVNAVNAPVAGHVGHGLNVEGEHVVLKHYFCFQAPFSW